MATGDTPNQNLFGTNYNAEEEERKKAELAAQGAMMGAGNVPASAFGQAPAVNPFSMEAAGQVNPMVQPQNLESFAQPQVTFRDYDVPATPPASALSVFTPGGEVKPNVDVNAITPSPETTSEVAPKNALLEMLERADERQSMGLPRQAAPGIIDAPSSVVDPFTGKTIEKPTAFAADNSLPAGMTMNQAAIMNALPDQNQGMDMNQQAIANAQSQEAEQGQVPAAPTNGLTTVGGASLSEFLSGQAMPERGFTQEESPLGGRGVTLTQDQMNELSAQREARLDARRPGDQSVSDRERRAARGDGISMADQTDMAKANARGATPRDIARGNQVADALGVDLQTGQPLQATGGLTETERLNRQKFELEQTKFIQSIIDNANTKAPLSAAQKKFAEESGKGAYSWDQGGRQTSQENIGKFGQIIQDLEQGQLDTRTLSEFVPFGGDWWRSALNPTGQQGLDNVRGVIFQGLRDTLGAQFTEKEGERLVNAAYNPKLNEEQNIARLKPALARMKATFQAKEALTKHIMDGGDIREYKGKTPMDVYKSFDGQAGSGSPIPGDVDVDIQSNAQAILDRQ